MDRACQITTPESLRLYSRQNHHLRSWKPVLLLPVVALVLGG
jgi:hypothetical protein